MKILSVAVYSLASISPPPAWRERWVIELPENILSLSTDRLRQGSSLQTRNLDVPFSIADKTATEPSVRMSKNILLRLLIDRR